MSLFGALIAIGLSASSADLAQTAKRYLGHPYVYGDKGEYGFDCSSFVQTVFGELGYRVPRTSRLQAAVGRSVSFDELEPGDLLFFSASPGSSQVSHVGIALDGERMIHASTGRGEVVIDPLDMRHYRLRRVGARRILDQPPEALESTPEDGGAQHISPLAPTLSSVPRPSLWHRGPVPLERARTSIGVRTMGAMLGESTLR